MSAKRRFLQSCHEECELQRLGFDRAQPPLRQHHMLAVDQLVTDRLLCLILAIVNLGGGFPARYVRKTPKLESYGKAIFKALRKHFGNNLPNTIVEPGRGLVGNAGVIEAEVVLIAKRSPEDGALGLSRHRQVPRSCRDHRRIDPLSDSHHA
jgi:diaminopimelate decarboxylase